MNFSKKPLFIFFSSLVIYTTGQAQPLMTSRLSSDTPSVKTVTMAAGKQFKASAWKQLWWGKHWRPEWLVPVTFNVFDIDTTAGGLTPLKRGGGHQTKSLRLLSKDGKEYTLRTMDKDLEVLIPEEFKKSFINDIANDQISTAHPYGPLAISKLTESIGCMHTNPVIVFVPDEPHLGEFRSDFANKLCLFEERPSGDGWEMTPLTNYANDVVNSDKLFLKLQDDNDRKVNQKEFLKIRFLDMLINDWDRHPDQWVWTGYKKNGKTSYIPFARDRDQGFSKTDGFLLYFLSRPWMIRSLRNLDANVKDVAGVNLTAISLDKEFTNELTKEDWLTTIQSLQKSLTDSVIHQALIQMPKDIYDMSGSYIEKRLRQRRDNMKTYGTKYFNIINKKITIAGSDKKEIYTINKIDNNTTEITIQKSGKKETSGDTLFHRKFTHDLTKEINIYSLGEDDRFVYKGQAKNKIFLRTIGGDGKDNFSDSTAGSGNGKRTRLYDTKDNGSAVTNNFRLKSTNDTSYTNFRRRTFKYDWWKPTIVPNYNPDDGFILGLADTYRKQGWHKTPYAWEQTIGGTVAAGTGAVGIYYKGIFKQAIGKWDIQLAASLKAPKFVLNYYGYGNETPLNKVEGKKYYRVRSSGFLVTPAITREWKNNSFNGGIFYESVKVDSTEKKYITQQPTVIDQYFFSTKQFSGAKISYTYSSIGRQKNPELGFGFHLGASYTVNLENTKRDFFNFNGYAKTYLPIFKGLVFAHRTGFATNTGDKYEFYQANAVGGSDNLRGYWRTRFTGQTSFYQNTELRLQVAKLKGYFFMGKLGVFGFFDDGRVWVKNDPSVPFSSTSNKMHIGYGGGIYFVPFNMLALNISYAVSDEVNVFAIRTGFFF